MGQQARKARKGRTKVICRAEGTPQWSATQPRIVVETPPIPMEKPRISPEAIPRFWGMKLWAMAMVVELEEMSTNPARVKKTSERVPWVA